jgi:hypothetical protein
MYADFQRIISIIINPGGVIKIYCIFSLTGIGKGKKGSLLIYGAIVVATV